MLTMRCPVMVLYTIIFIFCLSGNIMASEDDDGPIYNNKGNILGDDNNYDTHLNDMRKFIQYQLNKNPELYSAIKEFLFYQKYNDEFSKYSLYFDRNEKPLPFRIKENTIIKKASVADKKKDNGYMTPCHFKLCNLGRKRDTRYTSLWDILRNLRSSENLSAM